MITLLLSIIQLIILVVCFLLSILFVIRSVKWRKKKTTFAVYVTLSIVFITATLFLWITDFISAETSNREKAIGAFEDNFGFKPPGSVEEIKLKNYSIYDASAHWMAFTYDSIVFSKILKHDQPLDTAYINTSKYNEIVRELEKGCANCPNWLELPNTNTSRIYFKKGFLKHSFSEYHLWADSKEKMIYLKVSYFD